MNIKKLLYDQRGEGLISALYTMLILIIILFIGIDIFGYTTTAWKLRNACSETLTIMKIENGYDHQTEQIFLNALRAQKLDPAKVTVSGTPKYVQRGEQVTIRATTPYEIRSIRPFKKTLHLNISVEMWGLAQNYIRTGESR